MNNTGIIGNTSTIGSKGAYASGNFASKSTIKVLQRYVLRQEAIQAKGDRIALRLQKKMFDRAKGVSTIRLQEPRKSATPDQENE